MKEGKLKKQKIPKVFVGLSGGVDSSVSALLLKERGFDVTGVFIKGWYPDFLPCDWREDRRDAMRVCAKLDIPFLTLDAEKEYKKEVIDYMISEYKKGRTPNPDIMCNKEIKFGVFLKFAQKKGADFIATGHYAQIKKDGKNLALVSGVDKEKDQSYFLWTLNQKQLEKTMFPIGNLKKTEVRKIAKKHNLNTAEKKDSQGVCFLGKVDLKDFLSHYISEKPGDVLDTKGRKIGKHGGSQFLTIGQRHGFNIENKETLSKKMYVVSKDIRKNTITVSSLEERPEKDFDQKIVLDEVNWVSKKPESRKIYKIRTRYRQTPLEGRVEFEDKNWKVILTNKTDFITEGQSLVLYEGDTCLGGGLIYSV